ncbi:MAG TPA: hypothetical protein ENJ19_02535 [Gammaproteobacteria bacterium]|nr:hypothetical protein [Gammaproteobacteria bacterium]
MPADKPNPAHHEKLVQAYNRMLEHVKDKLSQVEHQSADALHHAVAHAKEKTLELGELTREEIDKLGDYLRRDLEDAGEYLADTGKELKEWFEFDVTLIESWLLEAFTEAADQTRLALLALEQQARRASEYHTGEITGVGTLVCQSCGERLHFHHTGRIPPCPKCHGTMFKRRRAKP